MPFKLTNEILEKVANIMEKIGCVTSDTDTANAVIKEYVG